MSERRRRRDERGAFLVLWSILVTGMMVMMAIVLDLGHIRAERRFTQSVADVSLLAGGGSFSTPVGLDPMSACQDTVKYLNQNLRGLPGSIDPVSFCNQSGKELDKTVCNPPHTKPQATPSKVTGPYEIELRYPVPDADIADAQTGVRSSDGQPCERMKLTIKRTDSSFFAGIVGVKSLETRASATIRRMPVNASLFPALWLLDPHECTALAVDGTTTEVIVGTTGVPGVVTIDSDGKSCSGQQATLDAGGGAKLTAVPLTGTGYDRGSISLYAHPAGKINCDKQTYHDCDEADVPSNIQPQPIRRDNRATRAPVDWRYNCKKNYLAYSTGPGVRIPIKDCPNAGTATPFVERLGQAIGSSGSVAGFTDYHGPCTLNGAAVTMPAGNVRVTCTTFRAQTDVTFPGGNVVFDGDVHVTGQLRVNQSNPSPTLDPACVAFLCPASSSATAAVMYLRKGTITVNGGGGFDLKSTVVFQDGGILNFGGGGTPKWSAPTEGPFRGLAYWNEHPSNGYSMSGGSAMSLSGVFFTPFADPFSISGGAPAVQQDAQFVSRKVTISGGGTLNLAPRQSDAISLPPPSAVLIR